MKILGLSAYYHDSAAALVIDGQIIAAAQEERFSRKKHDARFPSNAIRYCLFERNLTLRDLDYIVFYDKPLLKFERLLETYIALAPRGYRSFTAAMPVWIKEKLFLKTTLKRELASLGEVKPQQVPKLLFTEHHQAHAAGAFFPSPFQKAAVLCLDGVGEWATTSVWKGLDHQLIPQWQIDFPHSLGLLYSAFTYFTGFKVNSGEYKLMGLAPYGEPKYTQLIYDHLLDLKDDGTYRLNLDYFNFATGLTMTNERFSRLFGRPPRSPESDLTQQDMDIAASIQQVTEEVVLRLARTVKQEVDSEYLCLSGGVALNCVANGRILRECGFKDLWIQPAAGDAGSALGAALSVWHEYLGNQRVAEGDRMAGAYLGPRFSHQDVKAYLEAVGAVYDTLPDEQLFLKLAEILEDGQVVGWFQGRMEFGPRALGNRSIIGDPRNRNMQSTMNLKIKYRESFRPFAPSVLAERVSDYFEMEGRSPYMLLVAPVRAEQRHPMTPEQQALFGIEKLRVPRSEIPSVTHVDYSARIQTVHADTNPRYHALIRAFEQRTGCGLVVNTSFNVRGEPIVCTPGEAYHCFMNTEMDYLVLENCLLSKREQPEWQGAESPESRQQQRARYLQTFELD
ncbi:MULTISPECIES: carbamoyltransferase [unclassified Leptolyngbya]|uniref:carbamoyltransferase family protein n=1 Tax=unclassified Leptolyngbya TaxID=2650499 RepID=UPI0016855DCB|nr:MULTISPECIES: carbamoyltransferase [unclassified Leptolyngbya]MBD1911787.1 carbamoyltransferase [Leptolyngbya sp. FACHB-8]MBD2153323.1 carbamoyltransferase [Leptolyngbya sp. FACHB-16]